MDRAHRWTAIGVAIVILAGISLVFLPFLGLLLAAVVAGTVVGYGLADPNDGARAGLVAGFAGGAVPAVLHISVFITVSAHDPDPPSLLSVAAQPMILFGGLVLASAVGAVSIGSAALVGYLRTREIV